jgi:ornithine carbamoyltransferase
VLACPEGYYPNERVLKKALALKTGRIRLTSDPVKAIKDADVIYTDVWASMGKESESASRKRAFAAFQVNSTLMKKAPKDAIVMHCLPAHRGEEVSNSVLEGPLSVVWDQSENKMHMHKAILETLMSH